MYDLADHMTDNQLGLQEVKSQRQVQPGTSPVLHSPAMDIFQRMANDLDTEGRYLFLNALANQLRYPNNHTHYFSCILLYLFSEAKKVDFVSTQVQVKKSARACSTLYASLSGSCVNCFHKPHEVNAIVPKIVWPDICAHLCKSAKQLAWSHETAAQRL